MNLPFITAHASKSQPLLKMRVTAFLAIAAITGLALPSIAQAANPATVSLTVHYQRPESDYTKWNLWLWKNLTTGSDVDVNTNGVEFTSEDSYGKIATVEITGMDKFDDIGIIVRKGSWDAKDVEADRFIKQIPDDGKVEIWLRQGDSQIYYQAPTEPAPVNTAKAQSTIFDSADFIGKYTYLGNDLGNTYSKSSTAFRVWAPTATAVSLLTYEKADSLAASARVTEMKSDVGGTWVTTLPGDNNGVIYTYRVAVDGGINEAVDPYVRATTVNGARGVVIDLSTTNPANWTKTKPAFSGQMTDAIIYELHVRDLSMDSSSGIPAAHKGKFLALTDINTTSGGQKTGVSSIKELGITHIELLPIFDYASVNENEPTFNWGYDPQNYNVPEGSYSTDPTNPTTRITELKSAIQALHDQKLRVNMDVVYNHVYNSGSFSQNLIVPGYFFRTDDNGGLTNGSGCGNDVASERPMVRKFIVDSVKYWASEYNLDGFRFDLMGLMDIQTINEVTEALAVIDPTILVIGEGWNMGTLPNSVRASQTNISKLPGVAHFNDQIRDGIKGSVFNSADSGYATGKFTAAPDVIAGIVGNTQYSDTLLSKWTTSTPGQSVNYVESHDNMTLADKITSSVKGVSPAGVAQLSQFATSIAFLAQGVPFMQAGQEFLRSKNGEGNSYKSDDATNSIKWSTKAKFASTFKYYQGLIALRSAHPAFRMTTTVQIKANLKFLKFPNDIIGYSINGKALKDKASTIMVIHNPNPGTKNLVLPNSKKWSVLVQGAVAGNKVIRSFTGNKVTIAGQSTLVLTQ
ncbi:MAG: type I pullulanase [Actinobacteria bacterium]|uniref:pullulanase n=1 Tax=freshwater metagenome TaxID=449393 RepID=A0A6J7DTE2_9ZZZZ|nr:type I pullulanase [Actinomycetota bacterium]